jgi:hypothetical protein
MDISTMKAKRNKEENNPSDLLPAWTIGGMAVGMVPANFKTILENGESPHG